jgi:hypothetical protein
MKTESLPALSTNYLKGFAVKTTNHPPGDPFTWIYTVLPFILQLDHLFSECQGALGDQQKSAIQIEYQQILKNIHEMSFSTEFNQLITILLINYTNHRYENYTNQFNLKIDDPILTANHQIKQKTLIQLLSYFLTFPTNHKAELSAVYFFLSFGLPCKHQKLSDCELKERIFFYLKHNRSQSEPKAVKDNFNDLYTSLIMILFMIIVTILLTKILSNIYIWQTHWYSL